MASSRSIGRRATRLGTVALAVGAAAAAVWAVKDIPAQFGAQRATTRGERVRRSPQFRDGTFHNAGAGSGTLAPGSARKTLHEAFLGGQTRRPRASIPVLTPEPPAAAAPTGLHITWYGHASTLVEIEGARVLFDPIWSERCSPSRLAGPRRLHPVPLELDELPEHRRRGDLPRSLRPPRHGRPSSR